MPSIPSRFGGPKLSEQWLQTESGKLNYIGRQATVCCHECNRVMVPRVVVSYGQPLKSICPFCGTTFMRFPSRIQKFIVNFHTPKLSFVAFKRLSIAAICFGLLWLMCVLGKLPDELSFLGTLGCLMFAALASAELLAQCIEQLAIKFAHQSKYYWAVLIMMAVFLANTRDEFTRYIVIFSLVMLVRWFISGLAQARNTER